MPSSDYYPFHLASSWEPPTPHSSCIEQYISHLYREISCLRYPFEPATNISWMELEAIQDLKSNTNIIIKPADKGGNIVILDKTSYLQEAYRQLNDSNYYTLVYHDPFSDLALGISSFISFLYHKEYIDYKTFRFLDPKATTRGPIFYLLPKIHKPGTPGRPIISGCNSPTSNLSTYIDFYLKPIVKQLPSYMQDTKHFLRTLRTFDVKSLYTNIPHYEGITFCSTALQTFYGQSLPLPLKYMLQFITLSSRKIILDSRTPSTFRHKVLPWGLRLPPTTLIFLWTTLNGKSCTLHQITKSQFCGYVSLMIFLSFGLIVTTASTNFLNISIPYTLL